MSPDQMYEKAEDLHLLAEAISLMELDEREVIMALWGIECEPEKDWQIARRLGIGRDDVQQISFIAQDKIKRHMRGLRVKADPLFPVREPDKYVPKKRHEPITAAPRAYPRKGFLYVVKFSSDLVKVGRSKMPTRRIRAHESEAVRHGLRIEREWISDEHNDCELSESRLIQMCQMSSGAKAGREYFRLDFAEVVNAAQVAILFSDDPSGFIARRILGERSDFRGFTKVAK
jgi:hypothetical protein